MKNLFKVDKTKVQIIKRGDESTDLSYWAELSPVELLMILEQTRLEYNQWKYGTKRRFQRVYKVIKRKWS